MKEQVGSIQQEKNSRKIRKWIKDRRKDEKGRIKKRKKWR